jgi:hypothetical protein
MNSGTSFYGALQHKQNDIVKVDCDYAALFKSNHIETLKERKS